jgi:hypothetical protein
MAVQDGHGKMTTSGLVFAYDVKDQVNSYLGEPTQNLALDSLSQGGWPGSHTLIDSETKTFDCTTSSIEWGGGASWTTFYYNVSEYTGQYITISAIVESIDESNGLFNFIWIGQTINNETYLGYSPEADRNTKTTKTRERISWSGIVGSGGKVGILIWMNNGSATPGSVTVRFTNVQVELKSHPTVFTSASRTSTQSLFDLTKGLSSINLNAVSFNQESMIEFDGSNDLINLGSHSQSQFGPSTSSFTMEFVYKVPAVPTKTTAGSVLSRYRYNFQHIYSGNYLQFDYVNKGYDDTGSYSATSITTGLNPTGEWNHIVVSYTRSGDAASLAAYRSGVLVNTGSSTRLSTYPMSDCFIGHSDHLGGVYYDFEGTIAVIRMYNRALTQAEVLQNYKTVRTKYGIS